MKKLLIGIFLLFNIAYSQTPSPIIEDFNSTDQPGEWKSVTGQSNTGAHVGQLCYNVTGNYLDNQYYSYESQPFDASQWSTIEVIFSLTQSIRNGDILALYYFDSATLSWSGWDISGLNGVYTVTLPTTATVVSFDFDTNTNGNVNGKYVHIDYIYLQDPASPLPIELVSFDGKSTINTNTLQWATSSEYNSDYFDLQQSIDNINWNTINKIPSSGYSTEYREYISFDQNPYDVVNYYRLVQYDMDGKFEIFGPIAIDNRDIKKRIVRYVNLNGQEVNPLTTTGLVLGILEDGSSIKVYL